MNKKERQEQIMNMLGISGHITVNEIMNALSVSDMTVRRDLNQLFQEGKLIRTHGGAQRIMTSENGYERSHIEKKSLHEEEKKQIAMKAASLIRDGETVFLGPGTTLEQLALCLRSRSIRVVTNSLPVFEILNHSTSVDLLLTGGEYRCITGAFVGTMAMRALETIRFSKALISVNGAAEDAVYTYSEAEGDIQKHALNCATEKILLADSSKFNEYDFYRFYELKDFDLIITDEGIEPQMLKHLRTVTDTVTSETE